MNYPMPPASTAPGIPSAAFAGPVAVNQDVRCRKCGYNLRGLSTDGRCPECGTAVAYSVTGDYIRFSDPDWVLRLRSGAMMILIGVCVMVVGVIAMFALGIVIGASRAGQSAATLLVVAGPLFMLAAQGLILFGTWRLTEPDPSGLGEDQYGTIRKFIRIALLVGLAGSLVSLGAKVTPLPDPFAVMLQLVASLCQLTATIGFCCQLVYLSRLAFRLPDEEMSRRAKTIAWMMGTTYGIIFASSVFMLLVRPTVAATGSSIGRPGGAAMGAIAGLGCIMGLAGLSFLVAGIMYLLLIEKFGKRLKYEAEYARQTWARLPSPQ